MPPTPDLLSLRSSCERCRFHKLKCTVPPNSTRCVRCARAKVDCTFSRRAKGRRQELGRDRHRNTSRRGNGDINVNAEAPSPSDADLDTLNGVGSIGLDIELGPELGDAQDTVPTRLHALLDESWALPHGAGDIADYSTISSWLDVQDAAAALNTAEDDRENRAAKTSLYGLEICNEVPNTLQLETAAAPASTPAPLLRLSNLAVRIHETMSTLDRGSWTASESFAQLEEYPIGSVLSLYQELSSVLRDMAELRPHLPRGTGLASLPIPECFPLDIEPSFSSRRAKHGGDERCTPTQLLVLSCYISLTALFEIVLSHFNNSLAKDSGGPAGAHSGIGLGRGFEDVTGKPGIRLGELPRTNDMWSRMWMAIYLLLRAFQSIEDGIWPPEGASQGEQPLGGVSMGDERAEELGYAGELKLTGLKYRLLQKVQGVKHLLQEKMNL
ncbi:hypothetical protein BDW66DRAFT_155684 [Aspergillus desertorum]